MLVVISPESDIINETKIVTQLLEKGLEYFHLRKPAYSNENMNDYIHAIPEIFHSKIVIHTFPKLALKYHLKGIHTNQRNLICPEEKMTYPKNLSWSASIHSIEDLNDTNAFEYVFLSPIFDSISKKDYKSRFSENLLKESLEKFNSKTKVIALGGIHQGNIHQVKAIGFDGAAVLGGLWDNPPQKYLQTFSVLLENYES